jgi:hypothetical protein
MLLKLFTMLMMLLKLYEVQATELDGAKLLKLFESHLQSQLDILAIVLDAHAHPPFDLGHRYFSYSIAISHGAWHAIDSKFDVEV